MFIFYNTVIFLFQLAFSSDALPCDLELPKLTLKNIRNIESLGNLCVNVEDYLFIGHQDKVYEKHELICVVLPTSVFIKLTDNIADISVKLEDPEKFIDQIKKKTEVSNPVVE
ncbi:hypothetical protein NUSPORA_01140 [Nucleospora cyclopteri]